MPLHPYGVLKGRVQNRRRANEQDTHYQIHLKAELFHYRAAINVQSQIFPSELECLIDHDFRHPILGKLQQLHEGFHELESEPGGLAIDYIRSNLFDPARLRPIPLEKPGPNNDLNEHFDALIKQCENGEACHAYVYGVRFGPNRKMRDTYFHFKPMLGLHDIHMNQGNTRDFLRDDGPFQDGALLLHFPGQNRWIGVFLKFQSQCWHTHDKTGHREPLGSRFQGKREQPFPTGFTPPVVLHSAMINPPGGAPEQEWVTLVNLTGEEIALDGWEIRDDTKNRTKLTGALSPTPRQAQRFDLAHPVNLGNNGGLITLIDPQGWKIDGIAYTRDQGKREGEAVVFRDLDKLPRFTAADTTAS